MSGCDGIVHHVGDLYRWTEKHSLSLPN
jgi:hypothetical protein